MAKAAGEHAEVVAANIRSLIDGGEELTTYRPGPPGIALPLGPAGGASHAADQGILDADTTSQVEGADLMTDIFAGLLNLA